MKLSNVKDYDVSAALIHIDPTIIASVWFDNSGVGTIIYDDEANPSNIKPTEDEIDAAGQELPSLSSLKENEEKKHERRKLIEALTVTTVSGNEFNANEQSQERITRAVLVLNDAEETDWKLANDTWIKASKEELKEALRLAGVAQTQIWKQADQV